MAQSRNKAYAAVPELGRLRDEVIYGEIWEQKDLGKRDRSLVTVAALVAMHRPDQLRSHLRRALDHGVTRDEIRALVTHLAFYAGWPNAVTAADVVGEVFAEADAAAGSGTG